eukprot:8614237-Ditylum_brightwellii.AAC.1
MPAVHNSKIHTSTITILAERNQSKTKAKGPVSRAKGDVKNFLSSHVLSDQTIAKKYNVGKCQIPS